MKCTDLQRNKYLLTRHVLPEDMNKYIVEMASNLYSKEDLQSKTAAQLEKTRIEFMSSK